MLGFDSQRTGATLYAHLRYTKVGSGNWMGRHTVDPMPLFAAQQLLSPTNAIQFNRMCVE